MYDKRGNSVGRQGVLALAATFAGVVLLGGIALGVEYLELGQRPSSSVVTTPSRRADDRTDREIEFQHARQRAAVARRHADDAELAVFEFRQPDLRMLSNNPSKRIDQSPAKCRPVL